MKLKYGGLFIESEKAQCPNCSDESVSPDTLVANSNVRTAVINFQNKTGYVHWKKQQDSLPSVLSNLMGALTRVQTPADPPPTKTTALVMPLQKPVAAATPLPQAPLSTAKSEPNLPPAALVQAPVSSTSLPASTAPPPALPTYVSQYFIAYFLLSFLENQSCLDWRWHRRQQRRLYDQRRCSVRPGWRL